MKDLCCSLSKNEDFTGCYDMKENILRNYVSLLLFRDSHFIVYYFDIVATKPNILHQKLLYDIVKKLY